MLYFELDEKMGVLKIVVLLDREIYLEYDLMIEVRNEEEILCYSYLYFVIYIIDVDDFYLDFIKLVYDVSVFEYNLEGIFVIVIYVID